jgi:hypothetical protein
VTNAERLRDFVSSAQAGRSSVFKRGRRVSRNRQGHCGSRLLERRAARSHERLVARQNPIRSRPLGRPNQAAVTRTKVLVHPEPTLDRAGSVATPSSKRRVIRRESRRGRVKGWPTPGIELGACCGERYLGPSYEGVSSRSAPRRGVLAGLDSRRATICAWRDGLRRHGYRGDSQEAPRPVAAMR